MKKINENTKVTLTLSQLKSLVKEARDRPSILGTNGFVELMLRNYQSGNPDKPLDLTQEQKDEIGWQVHKVSGACQNLLNALYENGCGEFANEFLQDFFDRFMAKL